MLANTVTIARMLITFVVVVLFGKHSTLDIGLIFTISLIFSLDALDGCIARKCHKTSETGALLDTLADRIIENTFWIYFTARGLLPLWVPIVVMARGVITDALQRTHVYPEKEWTHVLTRSRLSRGLYGSLKMITFMSLASVTVFKKPFLEKMSLLLALAAIMFCLLRAVPIFFQYMSTEKNKCATRILTSLGICCAIVSVGCFFVRTKDTPIQVEETVHERVLDISKAVARAAQKKLKNIRLQGESIRSILSLTLPKPTLTDAQQTTEWSRICKLLSEILQKIEHAENTRDLEGLLQQMPAVSINALVEQSLEFGKFSETEIATLWTLAAQCARTFSQLQIATAAAPHIQTALNTNEMTIKSAEIFFKNVCDLKVDIEIGPKK